MITCALTEHCFCRGHLVIQVELEGALNRLDARRLVWCKYVPDEEVETDPSRDCAYHFAVLQNNMV